MTNIKFDDSAMNKQHRTALVVDGRVELAGTYLERVRRLWESVNGLNIKVDGYILGQSNELRRFQPEDFDGDMGAEPVSPAASADVVDDIREALASYDLVLYCTRP